MNLKNTFNKTDKSIAVISLIGILILVNFFSYKLFYRWDLTQNKDYSISDISKRTARDLDDLVNIKVYFSNDLPNQFINLKQEVGDILDEYANYSSGDIKIEFIDPGEDEDIKRDLYMQGIPELQFEVYEKDKLQLVKGYLGMTISFGDKTESIPVVRSTENLEYQITLAIKKVTSSEMSVVGFVTSQGTINFGEESASVYDEIRKIYEVRDIDLVNSEIADDVKTLVIAGPTEQFAKEELEKIDNFVMRGGSLLVLLDGVKIGEGLSATPNKTGLEGLLAEYGVSVNNNLVLDTVSGMASFNQGFFVFTANYPFWPKVTKDGFSQENAAVAKLENVIFPWVSDINILDDKIDDNNKIVRLAETSDKSWVQTGSFDLNPQQQHAPTNQGKKTVAVSVNGKFSSPYDDKSVEFGRLIVIGDSDFVKERIAPQNSDNLVFFQNLVDSLSLDEDLISIRSKGVSDRPLEELTDSQKALIRYANVFGITIIVVAFGLFRYYSRRRSSFVDEI